MAENTTPEVNSELENTPVAEENAAPVPEEKGRRKKGGKKADSADAEARLAAAEAQLADAQQKADEIKSTLMRTAAEYENYRKRSQREQECSFGNGIGHAACALLPIIDTLEAAAHADSSDEEYKKGVLLTLTKCEEVFKKLGIEEINALGEGFDPELHNAVMQDEATEGIDPGTVTKVLQKGYTLNGKVIRHVMVAVAP